jgi:hypothetical protein
MGAGFRKVSDALRDDDVRAKQIAKIEANEALRKGGPGSGPRPSGGSRELLAARIKAHNAEAKSQGITPQELTSNQATKQANQSSEKANASGSKKDHKQASEDHNFAAHFARGAGNAGRERAHYDLAVKHANKATKSDEASDLAKGGPGSGPHKGGGSVASDARAAAMAGNAEAKEKADKASEKAKQADATAHNAEMTYKERPTEKNKEALVNAAGAAAWAHKEAATENSNAGTGRTSAHNAAQEKHENTRDSHLRRSDAASDLSKGGPGSGPQGGKSEEIGVKGNLLQLGGGSQTSIADDAWVVFETKDGSAKLTESDGKPYVQLDSYDKSFPDLKAAAAWLNDKGAKYVGIDMRRSDEASDLAKGSK